MSFQTIKNIYHKGTSVIANVAYNNPSKKLKVIGVTGTDGKTTTSSLIYHILKSAGKKVSMVSTVYAQIGGKIYDTGLHVTTPSPFDVQKFLKLAVDHGDEYFVLETTSHALDQYRVGGTEFEIGVITNITHDHLDYHKTYENYVSAKTKLLTASKYPIINADDMSFPAITKILDKKYISYGLKQQADYQFDISQKLFIRLAEFNKYNYLAAYAACTQLGLSEDEILSAMPSYHLPPGRLELIHNNVFSVIVDFAHTAFALHEALKSIREEYVTGNGRLIHSFGAAGLRDHLKRPHMGEESGTFADLVILTEEDYRTEDPHKIAKEVAVGLKKKGFKEVLPADFGKESKTYTILVNRADAVQKAIQIAQEGDVIAFTGKGHEQSLCRENTEYHWNDKEELLNEILKKESNMPSLEKDAK